MDDLEEILPETLPGFAVQADASGPMAGPGFPGSTRGVRVVMISGETVVSAMASGFESPAAAHGSVEGFARVLFADPSRPIPLEGLGALSEDARGAVASPSGEAPGALAMLAWSVGSIRLDLSVSVLREDVTERTLWEAFARARFDDIAAGMQARAQAAGPGPAPE